MFPVHRLLSSNVHGHAVPVQLALGDLHVLLAEVVQHEPADHPEDEGEPDVVVRYAGPFHLPVATVITTAAATTTAAGIGVGIDVQTARRGRRRGGAGAGAGDAGAAARGSRGAGHGVAAHDAEVDLHHLVLPVVRGRGVHVLELGRRHEHLLLLLLLLLVVVVVGREAAAGDWRCGGAFALEAVEIAVGDLQRLAVVVRGAALRVEEAEELLDVPAEDVLDHFPAVGLLLRGRRRRRRAAAAAASGLGGQNLVDVVDGAVQGFEELQAVRPFVRVLLVVVTVVVVL